MLIFGPRRGVQNLSAVGTELRAHAGHDIQAHPSLGRMSFRPLFDRATRSIRITEEGRGVLTQRRAHPDRDRSRPAPASDDK